MEPAAEPHADLRFIFSFITLIIFSMLLYMRILTLSLHQGQQQVPFISSHLHLDQQLPHLLHHLTQLRLAPSLPFNLAQCRRFSLTLSKYLLISLSEKKNNRSLSYLCQILGHSKDDSGCGCHGASCNLDSPETHCWRHCRGLHVQVWILPSSEPVVPQSCGRFRNGEMAGGWRR